MIIGLPNQKNERRSGERKIPKNLLTIQVMNGSEFSYKRRKKDLIGYNNIGCPPHNPPENFKSIYIVVKNEGRNLIANGWMAPISKRLAPPTWRWE